MRIRTRIGPLLAGSAVAAAGLLAALALVFTNASGVDSATDNAAVQQAAESALGVSATTRFALGQELLFRQAGGVDPRSLDLLAEDSSRGLSELDSRVESLSSLLDRMNATSLVQAFESVRQASDTFDAALEAGATEEAATAASTALAPALDRLDGLLIEIRDTRARALAEAQAKATRVGTSARFMVALGVPGLALVIAALASRRRARQTALQSQLEHEREVNRSKDQLIANLSHELRTPLTGIYGSALAIEENGFNEPDIARELTGMIVDQSAELTRMVEDLLASAQADVGRLAFQVRTVPVEGEVDAVLREFARSDATLGSRIAPADVEVDPMRLRQILRNLVSNAVRHGGDRIAIIGRATDTEYTIAVVDDGDGVPSEIEGRLFTPFIHQGDQPLITGSVGLGLSITKLLAEGMGGRVDYRRSSGKTSFAVTVPKVAAAVAVSAPPL